MGSSSVDPPCVRSAGHDLTQVETTSIGTSQVVDIPPVEPIVVEAHRFAATCHKCGHEQAADYPTGLEPQRVLPLILIGVLLSLDVAWAQDTIAPRTRLVNEVRQPLIVQFSDSAQEIRVDSKQDGGLWSRMIQKIGMMMKAHFLLTCKKGIVLAMVLFLLIAPSTLLGQRSAERPWWWAEEQRQKQARQETIDELIEEHLMEQIEGKQVKQIIDSLVHALKYPHRNVRAEVAEFLGRLERIVGRQVVLEVLMAFCSEDSFRGMEDAELRRRAAELLGEIGDRQAIEVLTRALLEDPSLEVAAALRKLADRETIETLAYELLASPSGNARVLAELGEFAIEPLIQALRSGIGNDYRLMEALVRMHETAINRLVPLLKDEDEEIRLRVVKILGRILFNPKVDEEQVIPALKEVLGDRNREVRQAAYSVLVREGAEIGGAEIIFWTYETYEEIKKWAVTVMGVLTGFIVLKLCLDLYRYYCLRKFPEKLLTSWSRKWRVKAAQSLATRGDSDAINALIVQLQRISYRSYIDDYSFVIEALGKIGASALEPLYNLLSNTSSGGSVTWESQNYYGDWEESTYYQSNPVYEVIEKAIDYVKTTLSEQRE